MLLNDKSREDKEMRKSFLMLLLVVVAGSGVTVPGLVHALPENCYPTGNGPIVSCFHGSKEVTVYMAFTYVKDGKYYSWNQQMETFCFSNEYGKQRCMQIADVKALRCGENEKKQVFCE